MEIWQNTATTDARKINMQITGPAYEINRATETKLTHGNSEQGIALTGRDDAEVKPYFS